MVALILGRVATSGARSGTCLSTRTCHRESASPVLRGASRRKFFVTVFSATGCSGCRRRVRHGAPLALVGIAARWSEDELR
jgi:hypothetical protein